MPITEEEKQYIIEEETLRFETKKKLMQEEFGRWGGWGMGRMGWPGHGCHRHFWGFGFLKVLVLILAVVGLAHLLHGRPCGWGPYYYGAPAPQSAPPGAKS
ncbi:MAG TPA: hypothetical protein VFR02_04605 [bacterium]|nr:hypothetical protein [bacterium]